MERERRGHLHIMLIMRRSAQEQSRADRGTRESVALILRIIPRYVTWPLKAPFQGDGGLDKSMKALFALMGLAM